MKRFFGRKDSKSTSTQKPSPVAVTITPPAAAAIATTTAAAVETGERRGSESNDFLAPNASAMADTARKRPTFFDFGSVAGSMPKSPSPSPSPSLSQAAHSDASSVPLTGGSISGSSDASSSAFSTPGEDPTVLLGTNHRSARTVSDATNTKTWPSWMSNISKSSISKSTKSKLQAVSSFTNVSRSSTLALRPSASSALNRPSTSTASNATTSDSDSSDESADSSWEEDDLNHTDKRNKKRRTKIRGGKTIRAPGGRQLSPHHQHSVKAQVRSIFGGHSVAAPLSRETSRALANLQALTIDALVPPTSAPPLVSSTSSIPFPRSSNKLHPHLHAVSSSSALHSPLHVEILRKRLLRRIERRQLTPHEQESIQVLATRSARPRNADKRKLPSAEETYEDSKAVGGGWSKGMKRWAMRPCFEERVVVYKINDEKDGAVVIAPVERDSRAAVAALEFSEGAEALAGLHRQNELPPPPSDIYVPASNRKLPPPLVIPRSQTGVGAAKPSTLLASSTNRSRLGPSRLRSPLDISDLQSNQDEDDLPLGVVMLQRRQKDEAEERKRRTLQEKAERERREEEKRKKYQEEVLAARSRREVEKGGILIAKKQDAWLNGEADALPPPPKPAYASHHIKSSSNPNLATTSSGGLQVPKPANRRMTSESSAVSSVTATATAPVTASASKPVDSAKPQQQQQPQTPMSAPSPWSGLPSRSGSFNASTMQATPHHPGIPHSNSFPRMPTSIPHSAPPTTQTGMNYGSMMMMPPMPDPMSIAMFEQGMLRPWTMVDPFGGHGSQNGSNEMLTPPRLPFSVGFGSSGDSSGSLTPPRFPNSRPPSWGSSSEDVRLTMQRTGGSLGARPISIASGSGESQDWRKSRSSMLVPAAGGDESRNRSSLSRSPQDRQNSLPVPNKAGHQRINTSTSAGRSEKSEVPSSFSKHSFLTRASSARPEDTSSSSKTPAHRSSSNNLRSNSTHNLHTSSSTVNLRSGGGGGSQPQSQSQVQSRSWTVPAPKPTNLPPKNPYGLPSSQSYGPSSGSSALRESFRPGLPSSQSTDAVGGGRQRAPLHAHSKSSGAPTKKSRLFG